MTSPLTDWRSTRPVTPRTSIEALTASTWSRLPLGIWILRWVSSVCLTFEGSTTLTRRLPASPVISSRSAPRSRVPVTSSSPFDQPVTSTEPSTFSTSMTPPGVAGRRSLIGVWAHAAAATTRVSPSVTVVFVVCRMFVSSSSGQISSGSRVARCRSWISCW